MFYNLPIMPGWEPLRELVARELIQAREEGKNPSALEALRLQAEGAGNDEQRLESVFEALLALPVEADFPFNEPSDLETIRALRPSAKTRRFPVNFADEDALFNRMHGAWLARCVGCALGKPVEGFMGPHHGLNAWQRQKTYLTAISPDEWPLRDYFPQHSPAEEQTGHTNCAPSTREEIAWMESDDDIRYTVIGQMVLREFGRDFSTFDVARTWMEQLPYRLVCTAETQAYRNFVQRAEFENWNQMPRPEMDWGWIAHHQNPYREWIGAQIRADSYGYAAPGNPELAAEFAGRDARVSHVKNGIYGAMFCAAMIGAAFALDDPREIIEAGLAEIPATSRLYSEMRQVIALCEKYNSRFEEFERVFEEIYSLLGHYDPVHTDNNCGLIVAALLLGGRDFHQTITLAVMGGLDSDCNGATVGSIIGAMLGAKALPPHWTARLHDTLRSQIIGYDPIPISECARRSGEIARKVADTSSD